MDTNVALRERTGFDHLGMRMLYGLFYPFCHCRGQVPQEIALHDDPIIFVCNHYELFGPLALMTSLKARFRVWSNEGLLEMEENMKEKALYYADMSGSFLMIKRMNLKN